jgi:ectoine hydroxylase-related dioxygenase (phytanoyl-CoA dioxygenase family)
MLSHSQRPAPKTPWFEAESGEAPPTPFDAETRAFVEALRADGVAVIDLGDEARDLCDQVIRDTEPYFAAGASRVQDAWYRSSAIRRLAAWARMRELLAAAYGRDPFPFQTLNFQCGSQQALHADTVHFHSKPERFMCGVWIALEDVAPGSGPLIYHPGSHRLPVMTMRDAGVNRPDPGYEDYGRAYVPRFAERVAASGLPEARALLKKGWALVWAANLAHGGAPIETEGSTRRSLVVHNYFEDCVYYTPMTSNEVDGRLTVRVPPNIRTGGWAWPRRDGQRVWPGLRTLLAATAHSLLRRPRSY